ncbi:MAG: ABC transporter ATP-binding protein [Desulfurococcales archaeon]|nr:ABC transporter ATP-binding protein [Desulfurococcales archaeon]
MTHVKIEDLTKVYGPVVAVDRMNLEIRDGEFFTFLGPSGCGKTTTLRLIAGFEFPDKGRILFDDEDVTYLRPYERNTAMVFQNYALWPHMTVFDNIAYGLKLRKVPKEEIRRKVKEVLELIRLEGMENRYPTQLSGGQQQRVALARALVVEPSILLLDEPLSNLDAKLRLGMREEIKRIQKELNITTIYVTHDQEEALTMSDRIAVMNKGKVHQVGTPYEIYAWPRDIFVATFLGRSNLLYGKVSSVEGDKVTVETSIGRIKGVTHQDYLDMKIKKGSSVGVIIRPESFRTEMTSGGEFNEFTVNIILAMFAGSRIEVKGKYNNTELLMYLPSGVDLSGKKTVKVYVPVGETLVLPWEKGLPGQA